MNPVSSIGGIITFMCATEFWILIGWAVQFLWNVKKMSWTIKKKKKEKMTHNWLWEINSRKNIWMSVWWQLQLQSRKKKYSKVPCTWHLGADGIELSLKGGFRRVPSISSALRIVALILCQQGVAANAACDHSYSNRSNEPHVIVSSGNGIAVGPHVFIHMTTDIYLRNVVWKESSRTGGCLVRRSRSASRSQR